MAAISPVFQIHTDEVGLHPISPASPSRTLGESNESGLLTPRS
jgi:hypothetical protein